MMSTKFDEVLSSPPSGRSAPLILDHATFGSARLLNGAPVPWLEPVECQRYFGQAQGLLRPDATLVDVGAAYAQHLALRPDLVETMGARDRTGYALKTLLADDALAEAVVDLVGTLSHTARQPLVLQVPAPLRWLALARSAAGRIDFSALDTDDGESASMYVADWLRRFGALPVTLLMLDGRRLDEPSLSTLVAEHLAAYSPLVNATEHYRWGLALRSDDALQLHGSQQRGAVLPASFWLDQPAPSARMLLADVPSDVEPEHVLERLASLS
jgi:hypothetical protein